MTLRSMDLNLFCVFEAVMQHRSVSGAAAELGLTPSAVSHALSRLRKALKDDLFVAGPSGMEPTIRAVELAPTVRDGMQRLSSAIAAKPFVPRDAVRTFAIVASDYPASTIIPPLAASLASKAPSITLRLFPGGRMDAIRFLDEGRVDLLLSWVDEVPERMCRSIVALDREALVVRAGHPLTQGILTKERLFDFPHVVVEVTGTESQGVDGFVDERGVIRRNWMERLLIETGNAGGPVGRVAITVPYYAPVAPIVEQTDMVATLPRRLAMQLIRPGSLVMLDLPYEPLGFALEAVWHQRAERDPGLRWLVAEMTEVMRIVDGESSIQTFLARSPR